MGKTVSRRCPDCGHRPGQFDHDDKTCTALPEKGIELCGHACTEWVEDKQKGTPGTDRRHVGHAHPETAQAMQGQVLPKSGSIKREVYDRIRSAGARGMTDDEAEQVTCRSHQTVSGMRNMLMNDGWVVDSGTRRKTRYGNDAIVWVAVAETGLVPKVERAG